MPAVNPGPSNSAQPNTVADMIPTGAPSPTFSSLTIAATEPRLLLNETDGGTNAKLWDVDLQGGTLSLRTRTDADAAGQDVITFGPRAAAIVTQMSIKLGKWLMSVEDGLWQFIVPGSEPNEDFDIFATGILGLGGNSVVIESDAGGITLQDDSSTAILIVGTNIGGTGVGSITLTPKVGKFVTIPVANLGNFANDAAAAAGGVPVSGLYRNGSVVMIRVA